MEPLCEPQFARVPPFRPAPDDASVMAALKHLQDAQRPVIVAGGGVRASGASAELVALAEALQIPGRDLAQRQGRDPRQSSALGRRRRHLFARERQPGGQRCRSRLLHRQRDRRHDHAFLGRAEDRHTGVQIDIDPEALGRNYPLLAGVNGDAKVTLARMLTAADRASAGTRKAWIEEAQKICKEWAAKYQPALISDAVPIRPERICAELTRHVPDNGIVVVDTGHGGMWMGGFYDLTSPCTELYAQRRPSRMGFPGRARREMCVPRPARGHVHR
jgi:acetolactate synthase-1/2/3 large subunit